MTITLTREEAQQLLEVFELFLEEAEDVTTLENNLIKMLRTRLAQPEPEPVAWVDWDEHGDAFLTIKDCGVPLYTAPPQREWYGLTDEEKEDVLKGSKNAYDAIERIEAKLKEKNT